MEVKKIQKELIAEAKSRGYNAKDLAIEMNIPIRTMQFYFALKTSSSKITEAIALKFNVENLKFKKNKS